MSENTGKDLEWRLTKHLIPFFGPCRLREFNKQLIKAFRKFKLAERNKLAKRIAAGERPVDKRGQKDNLRQRVLPTVVREANRVRRKRGAPPIREDITPHTLRRTFISLLLAFGRPVPFVQRQAGHTDPRTTLRIYTEVIDTDFGPTAEILELPMAYSDEDERPTARRRRIETASIR